MSEFNPPIDNPAWRALVHLGLPLELWRARIDVRISDDGMERLRSLKGKHVAIVSNHGDQFDPEVVFTLSDKLKEDFHFIAARECFDWYHGAVGWCFQNLGCYSVARGEADMQSFKMTREILVKGEHKLVMFPEGEVTRQADLVLPFRKGAFRLFIEAQSDLLKVKPGESVYLQPIGIRWGYCEKIMPVLHSALRRLEKQLRIVPPSSHIVDRIEYASQTMADVLETEYSAPHHPELTFAKRIIALREHVLRTIGRSLNVELDDREEHLVWFRHLNIALNSYVNANMQNRSAFQKRLHKEIAQKVERMRQDLVRMQHLIGITEDDDYRPVTPERLANRIAKIEREVLGKVSYKGVRVATIGVGEPIDLLPYVEKYEKDNHAAVDELNDRAHKVIQGIVDELDVHQQKGYAATLSKKESGRTG